LEAIKRLQPNCRFYNAGSSEEFGNVAYSPQDENHPARPRSPYGASKCAARTLVKVYRESYGIYAVQGWLFNHEGTRRGEEFVTRKITKAVANIFDAIVNDKPIVPLELGNIDAQRDWSDAEDMMDGVWRMLNQDKFNQKLNQEQFDEFPELYNEFKNKDQMAKWTATRIKDYVVGTGEKHTIREFVEKSFELVGIKGEWIGTGVDEYFWYNSGPKSLASDECKLVKINPKFYRPAEVESLIANPTKIKTELGYVSKTTFEGLVDKMVSNDLALLKFVV
jgi:GDPmannose 4,6-dehydratase